MGIPVIEFPLGGSKFKYELFLVTKEGKGAMSSYANIHNAIELMYDAEGSFTVYINGGKHILNIGELALFPSNAVHSAFTGDERGGKHLCIKLRSSVIFNIASNKQKALYMLQLSTCQKGQKLVFSREELEKMGISTLLRELFAYLEAPGYAADLLIKANMVKICALLLNYY